MKMQNSIQISKTAFPAPHAEILQARMISAAFATATDKLLAPGNLVLHKTFRMNVIPSERSEERDLFRLQYPVF